MDKSIKDLIKLGEGIKLEYKKTITHPEKIAKTLCAFANSGGGTILIGIDDNRKIIGIQPDEEQFMLEKAAGFFCKPEVNFSLELEEEDGKSVLLVAVENGPDKPYACLDSHGDWKYYIRSADQCLMVSKTVVDSLSANLSPKIPFRNYNRHEKALLDYLGLNQKITLKDYANLINVSTRRANRILVDLIRHGDIYEHDFNENSFYTLAALHSQTLKN